MTENRRLALNIAMGDYLSDVVTAEEYEEMELDELQEAVTIWEPFQYWSMEDVCKEIESLASNIETTLNRKDEDNGSN